MLAALPSIASFELLLVSDATDKVVHRFDSANGGYLGSFGGNVLQNPRSVALDQSNNTAYVLDYVGSTAAVVSFNYNTGALLSSFAVQGLPTYMNRNGDGTLNMAYSISNIVSRYSTAGNVVRFYTSTTPHAVQQGILLNDGFFYVSTRSAGGTRLDQFNYASGAFIQSFNWFADRLTPISGAQTFNAYASGVNTILELDSFAGAPGFGNSNFSNAVSNPIGVAVGHGGLCFAVGTKAGMAGVGMVQRYDSTTNTLRGTFGDSFLKVPTGMAIVVAPEPAGLAAIGLGCGALLGRRSIRAKGEKKS